MVQASDPHTYCAWCGETAVGTKLVAHGHVVRGKKIEAERRVPACAQHMKIESVDPENRRSDAAKGRERKKKWDRLF